MRSLIVFVNSCMSLAVVCTPISFAAPPRHHKTSSSFTPLLKTRNADSYDVESSSVFSEEGNRRTRSNFQKVVDSQSYNTNLPSNFPIPVQPIYIDLGINPLKLGIDKSLEQNTELGSSGTKEENAFSNGSKVDQIGDNLYNPGLGPGYAPSPNDKYSRKQSHLFRSLLENPSEYGLNRPIIESIHSHDPFTNSQPKNIYLTDVAPLEDTDRNQSLFSENEENSAPAHSENKRETDPLTYSSIKNGPNKLLKEGTENSFETSRVQIDDNTDSASNSYATSNSVCSQGKALTDSGNCALLTPTITDIHVFVKPKKEKPKQFIPPVISNKAKLNLIVIKTNNDNERNQPILVPSLKEKTVVLVLNEQGKEKIIEIPKITQDVPEVLFIDYKPGENKFLPFGLNLKDILRKNLEPKNASQGRTYDVGNRNPIRNDVRHGEFIGNENWPINANHEHHGEGNENENWPANEDSNTNSGELPLPRNVQIPFINRFTPESSIEQFRTTFDTGTNFRVALNRGGSQNSNEQQFRQSSGNTLNRGISQNSIEEIRPTFNTRTFFDSQEQGTNFRTTLNRRGSQNSNEQIQQQTFRNTPNNLRGGFDFSGESFEI